MKFQNPSLIFFLNGRTDARTSRNQYAPHFFKVGGIKTTFIQHHDDFKKKCSYHNVIFQVLFISKTVLFVHLCSSNVLTCNPGCIIVKVVSLIYSSDKTFLFHCSCLY